MHVGNHLQHDARDIVRTADDFAQIPEWQRGAVRRECGLRRGTDDRAEIRRRRSRQPVAQRNDRTQRGDGCRELVLDRMQRYDVTAIVDPFRGTAEEAEDGIEIDGLVAVDVEAIAKDLHAHALILPGVVEHREMKYGAPIIRIPDRHQIGGDDVAELLVAHVLQHHAVRAAADRRGARRHRHRLLLLEKQRVMEGSGRRFRGEPLPRLVDDAAQRERSRRTLDFLRIAFTAVGDSLFAPAVIDEPALQIGHFFERGFRHGCLGQEGLTASLHDDPEHVVVEERLFIGLHDEVVVGEIAVEPVPAVCLFGARIAEKDRSVLHPGDLPRIFAALEDPDAGVRSAMVDVIGYYGESNEAARKWLLDTLINGSQWERELAAGAIAKHLPNDLGAIGDNASQWQRLGGIEAKPGTPAKDYNAAEP